MKTILTILIFSFTSPSPRADIAHTREYLSSTGDGTATDWIDYTTVTLHGKQIGYLDVRRSMGDDGLEVVVLGCAVGGVVCDSPGQFTRLVSK